MSRTMTRKAVAPQLAVSDPSGPKSSSGTKNATDSGPVIDQRPDSTTVRKSVVLRTNRRLERRHTDSTHQASANIMIAGVRMPVQNASIATGQSPRCQSCWT